MMALKGAVFALVIASFCILIQVTYSDQENRDLPPCGPNQERYTCTNRCTEFTCEEGRSDREKPCTKECRLNDTKCYCSPGYYRLELPPCGPNEGRYNPNTCTNSCAETSCEEGRRLMENPSIGRICTQICRLGDTRCYCSSGYYRLGDRCVTRDECPPLSTS